METPAHENNAPTPAQRALDTLSDNTEDTAALNALADSDVVPDPGSRRRGRRGGRRPGRRGAAGAGAAGRRRVVPVFTSELEMAGLLPFVSRYRLVPLGALAAQWPADDLSLTIDGSSEHRLTLTSEGVRSPAGPSVIWVLPGRPGGPAGHPVPGQCGSPARQRAGVRRPAPAAGRHRRVGALRPGMPRERHTADPARGARACAARSARRRFPGRAFPGVRGSTRAVRPGAGVLLRSTRGSPVPSAGSPPPAPRRRSGPAAPAPSRR